MELWDKADYNVIDDKKYPDVSDKDDDNVEWENYVEVKRKGNITEIMTANVRVPFKTKPPKVIEGKDGWWKIVWEREE